jgi:hypothetical protein
MVNPSGQMGYDQTAITKAQAPAVTPESNAITESPAMTSQKIKDNRANICEAISQIKMGLRDGDAGFGSKVILLRKVSLAKVHNGRSSQAR